MLQIAVATGCNKKTVAFALYQEKIRVVEDEEEPLRCWEKWKMTVEVTEGKKMKKINWSWQREGSGCLEQCIAVRGIKKYVKSLRDVKMKVTKEIEERYLERPGGLNSKWESEF